MGVREIQVVAVHGSLTTANDTNKIEVVNAAFADSWFRNAKRAVNAACLVHNGCAA